MQEVLPGASYKILSPLSRFTAHVSYLADAPSGRVVVTVLHPEHTANSVDADIRLRAQLETLREFPHPHLERILDMYVSENDRYIVTEYGEGKTLRELLAFPAELPDLRTMVDCIMAAADGLAWAHDKNILHLGLTAESLFIPLVGGRLDYSGARVRGFGIAQITRYDETVPASELTPLFHTVPPEQLGFVGTEPDRRTDLYSLGAIFYRLLAGRYPFECDSLHALVQHHLHRTPPAVRKRNPKVPYILENIVMKLLHKDPSGRYASAATLKDDLAAWKNDPARSGPGNAKPGTLSVGRPPLIGREAEFRKLKAAFEASLGKQGGVIVVSGKRGLGKTRVVEELGRHVHSRGRTFLSVRCGSVTAERPFGAVKELLRGYRNIFFYYTPAEKTAIRSHIRDDLKKTGKVILALYPQMKEVIGEFPELTALEPETASRRFTLVVSRFFLTLSRLENGLVVFLDDAHRSDAETLDLMLAVAKETPSHPLLVVCATADCRETGSGPFLSFKDRTQAAGIPVHTIPLEPFTEPQTKKLASALLNRGKTVAPELSAFLHECGGGNPSVTEELLKRLRTGNAIIDRGNIWDLDGKKANRIALPVDARSILSESINLLDCLEREVLSRGAIIGMTFGTALLTRLCADIPGMNGGARRAVSVILGKAAGLRILTESGPGRGTYSFCREDIREAFYGKVEPERRKSLHQAVGLLLEETPDRAGDAFFYEAALHFEAAGDIDKTREYSFLAGMKAKESYAHERALVHLRTAERLMAGDPPVDRQRWLRCVMAIGEISLLEGRHAELVNFYARILPGITTPPDRAELLMRMSRSYFRMWDYRKCERYARAGLGLLGEALPRTPVSLVLHIAKELAAHVYCRMVADPFRKKRPTEKTRVTRIIVSHYYALCWQYLFSNHLLFFYSALRAFNLSRLRLGFSRETALFISAYAGVLTIIPRLRAATRNLSLSLKMKRKLGNAWDTGQLSLIVGMFYQFRGDLARSIRWLRRSEEIMKGIGDVRETANALIFLVYAYRFRGDFQSALAVNDELHSLSRVSDNTYAYYYSMANYLHIYYDRGMMREAGQWLERCNAFNIEHEEKNASFGRHLVNGYMDFRRNRDRRSLEKLEKARVLFETTSTTSLYNAHVYLHLATAYIDLYANGSPEYADRRSKRLLLGKLRNTCRTALVETRSWRLNRTWAYRINGRYYSLVNRPRRAERFLQKAVDACRATGRRHELAVTYQAYAEHARRYGDASRAGSYDRMAYDLFVSLDSRAFVGGANGAPPGARETWRDELPDLVRKIKNNQLTEILAELDEIISTAGEPEEKAKRLLAHVAEITGAERIRLFVGRDGDDFDLAWETGEHNDADTTGAGRAETLNEAIRRREPVYYQHPPDETPAADVSTGGPTAKEALLCLPVLLDGRVEGVCALEDPFPNFALSPPVAHTLNIILRHLCILHNAPAKTVTVVVEDQLHAFCSHYGCTPAESQVLALALQGLTNKQIGKRIFISFSTVRTHLNRIYQKTGSGGREELRRFFEEYRTS